MGCYMTKQNKNYNKDFKQEAINLALSSKSISGTAKELGIPEATLHGWVSKLKNKEFSNKEASLTGNNAGNSKTTMAGLLDENRRLNKELAQLREEKAILKKAAAYFAQELK